MASGHRRAITHMDVRPTEERSKSISINQSQTIDPFYSKDMVALAEEADKTYK